MQYDPKMHGYAHLVEFGSLMNSAVGPKKQPNAAETGSKSVHCSRGVNANTNVRQINAIQTLTKYAVEDK